MCSPSGYLHHVWVLKQLTDTLVSGLLYLRPPSQNPVFLNSHTNSVFLHFQLQLRTPVLSPLTRAAIILNNQICPNTFKILVYLFRLSKNCCYLLLRNETNCAWNLILNHVWRGTHKKRVLLCQPYFSSWESIIKFAPNLPPVWRVWRWSMFRPQCSCRCVWAH